MLLIKTVPLALGIEEPAKSLPALGSVHLSIEGIDLVAGGAQ